MNRQIVLVEYNNTGPQLYLVKSKKPITIDMVAEHFIKKYDFNENKDSLTFVDSATNITL